MPTGLLAGERMDPKDRDVASEYAQELLDKGNQASLDYVEGVGGNVTVHFADAHTIGIYLKNALQTICLLESELAEAKRLEAVALVQLGRSVLKEKA